MDKNSMVPTNSTLRVSDDKESVCKFFDDFKCNDERVRNIQFFRENPMFSPIINYTYSSGNYLLGYNMEYIPGGITFKDAVGDESYTHEDKVKAINGVFSKLKLLHKCDILVGDMHAQNLMFNPQDGYILDLDEVRFKDEDDYKFDVAYQLRMDDESPIMEIDSFYTDNVKATVCALSLLYGVDFEDVMHHGIMKISDLKSAIDIVIGDADFKGDVFKLLDSTDEVIYFDDVLAKQNGKTKNEVL